MSALAGKIALVTGSGSGLGRAQAVLLAERGAEIIVHDVNPSAAEETIKLIENHGVRSQAIVCDIRNSSAMEAAIQQVASVLGTVDILLNNAGIGGGRLPLEEIDEDGEAFSGPKHWHLFDIIARKLN